MKHEVSLRAWKAKLKELKQMPKKSRPDTWRKQIEFYTELIKGHNDMIWNYNNKLNNQRIVEVARNCVVTWDESWEPEFATIPHVEPPQPYFYMGEEIGRIIKDDSLDWAYVSPEQYNRPKKLPPEFSVSSSDKTLRSYLEETIYSLTVQLDDPECVNWLRVDAMRDAYSNILAYINSVTNNPNLKQGGKQ